MVYLKHVIPFFFTSCQHHSHCRRLTIYALFATVPSFTRQCCAGREMFRCDGLIQIIIAIWAIPKLLVGH